MAIQDYEKTPVTITLGTSIGYDGVEDGVATYYNVRMTFRKSFDKDELGNKIELTGRFYKSGDIDVDYGSLLTYDGQEYAVKTIRKARNADGTIHHTRVGFA